MGNKGVICRYRFLEIDYKNMDNSKIQLGTIITDASMRDTKTNQSKHKSKTDTQ
jgi:hypothetical protein